MAKKITSVTTGIETHWSLLNLLRENWGSIVSALGLTGVTGWLASPLDAIKSLPIQVQIILVVWLFVIAVFFVSGARAFLVQRRRYQAEMGAISQGVRWSGYTYERGDIIEGGIHSVADIFGSARSRHNLVFRNCQIVGPGVVVNFGCEISKCDFTSLPFQNIILADEKYADVTFCANQFFNCRFENCSVVDTLWIGDIPIYGAGVRRLELVPFEVNTVISSNGIPLQQSHPDTEEETQPRTPLD